MSLFNTDQICNIDTPSNKKKSKPSRCTREKFVCQNLKARSPNSKYACREAFSLCNIDCKSNTNKIRLSFFLKIYVRQSFKITFCVCENAARKKHQQRNSIFPSTVSRKIDHTVRYINTLQLQTPLTL